jgi:hypothetical protein
MPGKLKPLDVERETRPSKYPDGDGLYLVVARRATELLAERAAIDKIVATSGLVEFGMRAASQPNPSENARPAFEKLIEKFGADVDQIRKMSATIWGSLQVQSDRNAFVDLCFSMSDDLGLVL